jgi:hypothetical protein
LAICRYDLAIRRYDLAIRRHDLATNRYEAVLDSISYVLRAPKPLKIKYISVFFDMGKLYSWRFFQPRLSRNNTFW